MAFLVDLDRLHARLAGIAGFATVPRAALAVLPAEGVAHDHVLVRGTGWLLRVPRMSQFALDPAANIAYQAACVERLGPSGHAPRRGAVLAPGTDPPM
ncbi:MAG: aminoglycoside phosphotransferase, partial [Alphaproteobacteria bacterium]